MRMDHWFLSMCTLLRVFTFSSAEVGKKCLLVTFCNKGSIKLHKLLESRQIIVCNEIHRYLMLLNNYSLKAK